MTTYNINYYNILKLTLFFLFIGFFIKSVSKPPAVLIELILILSLLAISLIYLFERFQINSLNTIVLYIFFLYLIGHFLVATFMRPDELNIPFYKILQYNLLEFRLSSLGYFLPLIFIPLSKVNTEKFEKYLILLIKFSVIYALFEQFVSLIGFRYIFELAYSNTNVVTGNLVGVKSLGLYRIWGLVGAPQLLGVLHVITLFYFVEKGMKEWSFASILAVIASTSKTAYVILILLGFLYLLYKRRYFIFILLSGLGIFAVFASFATYFYLIQHGIYTDEFPKFIHFIGSIHGYYLLLDQVRYIKENEAGTGIQDFFFFLGILTVLTTYYHNNPLEIYLGKGMSYSIFNYTTGSSTDPLFTYKYLTSEYYILTYFNQYGILGLALLLYLFLLHPLYKILKGCEVYHFIPIAFFIATLHYPPQIPKLIMVLVGYAMWKIYIGYIGKEHEAR